MKLILLLSVFLVHTVVVLSLKDAAFTGLSVVDKEELKDGIEVETVEESFLDPDAEEFIPTHEWQEIKPGQAIPKGLHVRMDFQTGKKEAKILSEEENGNTKKNKEADLISEESSRLKRMKYGMEQAMKDIEDEKDKEGMKYWKEGDREGIVNPGKDHFTKEELKEAMKKFRANQDDVQSDEIKKESLKKKFRSIDELKEELSDLELEMKTDLEILREIYTKYGTEDISLKLNLLEDLEYYVHQIDNAVNFVGLGILELVAKDLNHTAVTVKTAAAFVIGSAAQSNPKVQVGVLEHGVLPKLIRMLSTETSSSLQNRVIFAVSALVRNFPFAQLKFLQQGGLQTLRDVFVHSPEEKLKLKIVVLLGDLIHEHTFFRNILEGDDQEASTEKAKQYDLIPLLETVSEQNWCDLVPLLLQLPSHDTREKTLTSMKELLPLCKHYFAHSIQDQLVELKSEYTDLAREEEISSADSFSEDEDSYFRTVADMIGHIITELSIRDEL